MFVSFYVAKRARHILVMLHNIWPCQVGLSDLRQQYWPNEKQAELENI